MKRRAARDRPGETGSQQEPDLHKTGNRREIFRGVDGVKDNQVGTGNSGELLASPSQRARREQSLEPRQMEREEASQ